MKPSEPVSVCVTHHFIASAERVFDAWLDPDKACKFLFATPTGQMVRTEIDARVGGGFNIVERRNGEDVAHVGKYLEIARPRRLVFTLSVPKYGQQTDRVSIEIEPLDAGCQLTLTHEMSPELAEMRGKASAGWRGIFEVLAETLPPAAPSCGVGLLQHASVPAKIAPLFLALAETLETHRPLIVLEDEDARREDAAYSQLAQTFRDLSDRVQRAAADMASHRDLPSCPHREDLFGERQRHAFQNFVAAQGSLLEILRAAAERDEQMARDLDGMGQR
jgi:uncharacterized protein YndB with AHSA1/START domain